MHNQFIFGLLLGAASAFLSAYSVHLVVPTSSIKQETTIIDNKKVLNQLVEVQDEIRELKTEVSNLNLNVDTLHGKITSTTTTQPLVDQRIDERMEEISNVQDGGVEISSLGETIKWQKDLSAELREKMNEVYAEQHERVRGKLEAEFGPLDPNNPIPPAELEAAMKGDQDELEAAMKLVLPKDEYSQFIKSFE